MRIGRFSSTDAERPWCGVLTPSETVVDLHEAGAAIGVHLPRRIKDLIEGWGWQRKVEMAVEYAQASGTALHEREELDEYAPIETPRKLVCVGLNYTDHAEEGGNPIPDEPVLFSKFPTCVTGPERAIRWNPDFTESVDYEGELVAVIGRSAREVSPEDALDHVAGYTVGNDVSARDIQHGDGQWVRGKSLDTFAPIGPELVTTDEVPDPHDLEIWTELNGRRMQESTTANLIFGIDELVSFCSQAFTLERGDLLFTGTPPGVGIYRDPPVLLEEGDTVTVGIEGIGTLSNTCEYR